MHLASGGQPWNQRHSCANIERPILYPPRPCHATSTMLKLAALTSVQHASLEHQQAYEPRDCTHRQAASPIWLQP